MDTSDHSSESEKSYSMLGDDPNTNNSDANDTPTRTPSRFRFSSMIMLAENGSNFLTWKSMMPVYLQAEEYAWEVTTEEIREPLPSDKPLTPDQIKQKKQFEIGNRTARLILLSTIHPNIIVNTFYDETETVSAPNIWRRIRGTFTKQSGILKDQAINQFMNYRYRSNKTVIENISYFKSLMHKLQETKADIGKDAICARLIQSLPADWESFKQTWGAKSNTEKDLSSLVEMITAEATRRGKDKIEETTAFFSRMTLNQRPKRPYQRQQQNYPSRQPNYQSRQPNFQNRPNYTQNTHPEQRPNNQFQYKKGNLKCFNCGKIGHSKWQCRLPQRQTRPQQREANTVEAFTLHMTDTQNQEMDYECQNMRKKTNETLEFIIDSGCSHHVVNNRELIDQYSKFSKPKEVKLGGSQTVQAFGQGNVQIPVQGKENIETLILTDVLFVPKMRRNLISVGKLTDDDYDVVVRKTETIIRRDEQLIKAPRKNGLFILKNETQEAQYETLHGEHQQEMSLRKAHETLAHIGKDKVKEILKRAGIPYTDDLNDCTACIQGKQYRSTYRSKPNEAKANSIGTVHADLCTPALESLGGAKYILCITDEYSGYRKLYLQKSKDETRMSI